MVAKLTGAVAPRRFHRADIVLANPQFPLRRLQWFLVSPSEPKHGYQFDLSGGILCLDFANTVSRRKDPRGSADHLTSYSDLTAFFEQSKLLSPERASELQAQARRN